MIVALEPEARRWFEVAVFGFWLGYPKALNADSTAGRPEGLETEADSFRRLGNELYALEYDLVQCLNEFTTAYEVLYRDPEHLGLKKFAVVYHTDNFHVRVHKLRETVYRLLALVVGLDHTRRPAPGDLSHQREQVRNGLHRQQLRVIAEALRAFESNRWIKQAVEARNLFVHKFRNEPEWPMLGPAARLHEFEADPDDLAEEIRRLTESDDLDRYAERKAEDLLQTLETIRTFRDSLYEVFLDELVKLLATQPAEIKQRFQWVADLRDLGGL